MTLEENKEPKFNNFGKSEYWVQNELVKCFEGLYKNN